MNLSAADNHNGKVVWNQKKTTRWSSIYVELEVDEKRLAEEIGKILQLRIAPVSALDPEAQIIYWLESIEGDGFKSGISISWSRVFRPRTDYIDVAIELSQILGARVATDVPEGLPQSGDPYYWLVADPSGSLRIIGENMKNEVGFVLDETDSFPFVR